MLKSKPKFIFVNSGLLLGNNSLERVTEERTDKTSKRYSNKFQTFNRTLSVMKFVQGMEGGSSANLNKQQQFTSTLQHFHHYSGVDTANALQMNPSQSSLTRKRHLKIPDYLEEQTMPQFRKFAVINEYGSLPFKKEQSFPINYPHIK